MKLRIASLLAGSLISFAASSATVCAAPLAQADYGWSGVIVDTCDEGGTCGVQQRSSPYNSAPKLYSKVLQDGSLVTVMCQTAGDLRSNLGHGSSTAWFQLDNGSYINSVYTNIRTSGIPQC